VKILVPYVGELDPLDMRMMKIIEFLGLSSETLALPNGVDFATFLEKTVPDDCRCLLVNPRVMKQWIRADRVPTELIGFLLSRFSQLLVHGLMVDSFHNELVSCLSQGRLRAVDVAEGTGLAYSVDKEINHICKSFAGLSFGPSNPANDHVLRPSAIDALVRHVISIGGLPLMAAVRVENAEVLFVASEDVADITEDVGTLALSDYFSRFVPHVMALRYFGGDDCWLPPSPQACIVVDDPLLRKKYGFLDFDSLLSLTRKHRFHTTIAFIPYNFRRTSPRIVQMFHENSGYLSLCFHGNDHTDSEFASTDGSFLNTALCRAEERMSLLEQMTGLRPDKVMVFPQGKFSVDAMRVLRNHNFYGAVNTEPCPPGETVRVTIADLSQPAVLRYAGFPLFIRRKIGDTRDEDIAFNIFFGKPVLVVEHHQIFQHPEALLELVARINSIAPGIAWRSLGEIASNSVLTRQCTEGMNHVRAYSGTIRIVNHSTSVLQYLLEWPVYSGREDILRVTNGAETCNAFEVGDDRIRLPLQLSSGSDGTFSLVYRNGSLPAMKVGIGWHCQAFLRRRLSEFRDNYLSKNQSVLSSAKWFQRRFLKV